MGVITARKEKKKAERSIMYIDFCGRAGAAVCVRVQNTPSGSIVKTGEE